MFIVTEYAALKLEQLITSQENMLLLSRIESRFCIAGSFSHEFITIAFYDEGAGLVAVIWVNG